MEFLSTAELQQDGVFSPGKCQQAFGHRQQVLASMLASGHGLTIVGEAPHQKERTVGSCPGR